MTNEEMRVARLERLVEWMLATMSLPPGWDPRAEIRDDMRALRRDLELRVFREG